MPRPNWPARWRPTADAPFPWDTAGSNGTEASKYLAADGHRLFDVQLLVLGGALAGIGGVCFSLAIVPTWVDGLTQGRGWIAVALVIFGFWRPGLTLVGAYLFGAFSSLSVTLQSRHVSINADLLNALPFLATIVILVVLSSGWAKKRLAAPASLGVPYEREER